MNQSQSAAFAAMSAAMAAAEDPIQAAVFAAEYAQLTANGQHHDVQQSSFDVLSPESLSKYLQISEESVIQEANAGRIPGRCIDGQWRFNRGAIVNWLQNVDQSNRLPTKNKRPRAGAGAGFDVDIEAEIAAIYAERRKHPVRGRSE